MTLHLKPIKQKNMDFFLYWLDWGKLNSNIVKEMSSPMKNSCWINLKKTQTSLFYFIIF